MPTRDPLLRLDSIDGGPVVEYRVSDGEVERRTLLPDGGRYRDGGSRWQALSEEEVAEAARSLGDVAGWLRSVGAWPRRASGPSGVHTSPRRLLSASLAQWDAWAAAAAREGVPWAAWARQALDAAARRR